MPIKPDPRNANKGTQRGRGLLEKSLRQYGARRSGVADKNGVLVAGNKSAEVAQEIGMAFEVIKADPTKYTILQYDDLDMNESYAQEIAIADNRVGEVSLEWDTDTLEELLGEGVDLTAFWHDDELSELLGTLNDPVADDPGAQVDRAEELREKWSTELGQLWQIGRHRILCGDSTNADNVARVSDGCQTLVFDPPWDAEMVVPAGDWSSVLVFSDGRRAGDVVSWFGSPAWVFVWDCVTSWYTSNRPLQRMKLCFWYGDVTTFDTDGSHYGDSGDARIVRNSRGTHAFVPDPRGKHLSDLYSEPITQLHDDGPSHGKPVDWMRMLIADCTQGSVLDPFVGTGTSIVACEQIGGRVCYALEIDPAMVAVVLERMAGMGLEPRRVD